MNLLGVDFWLHPDDLQIVDTLIIFLEPFPHHSKGPVWGEALSRCGDGGRVTGHLDWTLSLEG